jgi:hypothetical protein
MLAFNRAIAFRIGSLRNPCRLELVDCSGKLLGRRHGDRALTMVKTINE